MRCQACGAVNPADAKFCGDCGEEIVDPTPPVDVWGTIFKWIGIGVVGLVVLGMIAGI